ncbi:MAG TPA: hypothetical protein VKM72_22620 [Thermoanaerobaculia bacterium]|nr:hypothetical protein [Thermoanaerobaculia bacterium]
MAFVIRGPKATVLYVPDTDGWATWARPLPRFLEEEVDVALLDATFYAAGEIREGAGLVPPSEPLERRSTPAARPEDDRGVGVSGF